MSAVDYVCPTCRRAVTGVTVNLRGFCETHGWVFVDFATPREQFREMYPDYPTYDPEEDATDRPDE